MSMNRSIQYKNEQTKSNKWVADLGNGYYKNPILYADYSDPDVIRVGSDFYMVASTFTYLPGLPLLHSKDLVNWKVVNYIVPRLPYKDYDLPAHGRGIWAPSIRYHDNKFWVYFSMPDEGIFMSNTEDPFGEWSPLVCVKEVKGWIDPCPLWDDDGNAYLVHAFANSRCGIKSILQVCKMSPDGTRLLDEGKYVFDGRVNHPTIEGPKFYKRNGYYYIFAPAGGVRTGWQTVLRSKNVYGPYEDRIVLHQGSTDINGPHQGGLVELESGESWFIHFQDRDEYGRIIHLQPVKWENDWPIMGENINEKGIGEPVKMYKKPDVGGNFPIVTPDTSDDFDDDKLGLQWQWQANPKKEWYSLTENPGKLRMFNTNKPHENRYLWNIPNVLTQLFQSPAFTATVKVELTAKEKGDTAGLGIIGVDYSYICIAFNEGNYKILQVAGHVKDEIVTEVKVEEKDYPYNSVYLQVCLNETGYYYFSYSFDGRQFTKLGHTFKAKKGHWVGAKIGLFCVNQVNCDSNGYADFDDFIVE